MLLTPGKVALALGVSESSLKRWCDQGLIPVVRTPGGHRRLEAAAVVEFTRKHGREFSRPELLGLARHSGATLNLDRTAEAFIKSLVAGEETACLALATNLHLSGFSVSEIADRLIVEAFRSIGERWERSEIHVYQERRAVEICLNALHEIDSLLPKHAAAAPLAIGGAAEFDPYSLPGAIVRQVLHQRGWRTQLLGSSLPFATLAAAVRDLRPQLFWLSVATIADERQFLAEYQNFHADIGALTTIVVGGRGLTEGIRRQMTFSAYCDNFNQFDALAQSLFKLAARKGRKRS